MTERRLRILVASPPTGRRTRSRAGHRARELVSRLVRGGHTVEVVTTTLRDVGERPSPRTHTDAVDGARVTYLVTPLRYRWMGVTPTLPQSAARAERPDVAHVVGFRDPLTTAVAAWCRVRGVPYVVRARRHVPAAALRGAPQAGARRDARARRRPARRLVIVSSPRERDDVVAGGVDPSASGSGGTVPEPPPPGELRSAAGVPGRARDPLRGPDRGREGRRVPPRGRAAPPRRAPRPRRAGRPARDDGDGARRARRARARRAPPRPPADARPSVRPLPSCDVFVLASGARTLAWSPPRRQRWDAGGRLRPERSGGLVRRAGEALVILYGEEETVAAVARWSATTRSWRRAVGGRPPAAARSSWTRSSTRSSGSTARRPSSARGGSPGCPASSARRRAARRPRRFSRLGS